MCVHVCVCVYMCVCMCVYVYMSITHPMCITHPIYVYMCITHPNSIPASAAAAMLCACGLPVTRPLLPLLATLVTFFTPPCVEVFLMKRNILCVLCGVFSRWDWYLGAQEQLSDCD
jgi:hypothetical protein